jgi:hypothetical protein
MALSITKPTVGSDAGTWGTILNTALDAIVTQINTNITDIEATEAVADAALPVAGGTMTGELAYLGVSGTVVAAGSQGGPTYEMDLAVGSGWTLTATGDITFSFANPTADRMYGIVLRITNGGAHTITWPASVQWAGGTEPTLTSSGTDIVGFVTLDGGTSWIGGAQLDVS